MADVKLSNIKKSYGNTPVLHGIDLDIKHGEFVVLVGASGCGKSTLLRLIAGLEDISSGELCIGEQQVNSLPPAQRGIAMVFQSYALYPHMTVFKNMSYGLKIAGKGKDFIDAKVREAARILHIDHLLERLPRELSGGQRQRVAIGRAIVRDPNVFLFDEPLSNLDAALRVKTRVEIGKLHQELGATIIYVTHDQVEAMTLGDKIVVMNQGRVEQCGTPLELYQHPATRFVGGFIGSPKMNFIDGKVAAIGSDHIEIQLSNGCRSRACVEAGDLKVGDSVTLGVRPEHIEERSDAGTLLSGDVSLVERLGEASFIYMTLGDGTEMVVRGSGESTVTTCERIEVSFAPHNAHVFDSNDRALRRLKPGNVHSTAQLAQLKAVGQETL
ncbi:ABC transporter ATP-binding protein [Marinobacterium sedimentorum]|uniref:ABC transporter ATP-binding protein n=1 Tax=Marinobacterium sedimentorum TaxID=2927804 RepID=UPI0020C6DCD4|nr:sn-glycerol-3-phosphate ABC transporter ATP-binding protein UgpC [Marinobacterium sedimentorum]MCP8690170.1 sn-glycerol-3-phosphate ABC transporter ATP-binding protein UgpC [Marinobacterium sedimentorum]